MLSRQQPQLLHQQLHHHSRSFTTTTLLRQDRMHAGKDNLGTPKTMYAATARRSFPVKTVGGLFIGTTVFMWAIMRWRAGPDSFPSKSKMQQQKEQVKSEMS